jgi:hypothetical protein
MVARFAVKSAIKQLDPFRRRTDINLVNLSHRKSLEYVSFIGAYMTRANFRQMEYSWS